MERWFDAERNRKWDQKMETDAKSGRLRKAYERLKSENEGQPAIPPDEFLDSNPEAPTYGDA